MKYRPKNLQISFTGKNLTHFGGLYLLQKFLQKLNLRYLLSNYIRFPQRNNRYSISEEILAILYPIMLGLGRIETSHLLKHNGVFQYLTGLPVYPNPTTLRRFLLRMAPLSLNRMQTRACKNWIQSRKERQIIISFSSMFQWHNQGFLA